jgi:hypothetical protein
MAGGHDMATVMARKAETPVGRTRLGAGNLSRDPRTLADLITAVQDVVGSEDDGLVVATVEHLLRSGRLMGSWPEPGGAPATQSLGRR